MVDLDRRAMLRNSFFTLLAFVLLSCGPTLAGDRAQVDVIGYSADGRYFAFEEYGVQDGAGFAYSDSYVVDIDNDRWVVGTPVRLQANDETETVFALRQRARALLLPRLNDLAIDQPAQVAALLGDGVPGADGQSLNFGVPGYRGPGDVVGAYDLTLEAFPTVAASPCQDWFAEEPLGYALSITDFGVTREVHRDRTLPRSRGCPTAYRIFGIYLPFNASDISRAVALISTYPRGFEGADRRFVAVPLAYNY